MCVLVDWGVELTQQRKVIIAVLALAGGGLLVDRFVLGSGVTDPSSALAGEADPVARPTEGASTPSVSIVTLSERLAGLPPAQEEHGASSDAFASPAWIKTAQTAQAAGVSENVVGRDSAPPTIRLSAVIAGVNSAAVIDGKRLRPGDTITGQDGSTITLREVESGGVIIETRGQLFRVAL